MTKIFVFLCGCLELLGRRVGWDYYKASVYICIHLWPLLCVAMSLVMLGFAVSTANAMWITLCAIYAVVTAFGYWVVVRHYYPGTIYHIFTTCQRELEAIAVQWHTTYAVVNLVIYVLLFAAIMTCDTLLIMLMI